MTSKEKTVAAYMKHVPKEREASLKKIRQLCKEILKGYKESMAYGMPAYSKDGKGVAFASQKNHICFYILIHDVILSNKELLKGLNHGKGCIRYANPAKIDFGIIKKLLSETIRSSGTAC